MTTFDDRKDAFEKKYAHEQKLGFEVEAKTSKLFGLWAASQLGLIDSDAQTYAGEVVATNLDEPGFDDILRKVAADFAEKGLNISDHTMKVELEKCVTEARNQILAKG